MKLRSKVLATLGGLAIASSFAMASVAAADVDAVAFTGAAGSLSTPIGLNPSSGTYHFSSTACAFVSADTDAEAGTCSITSDGNFVNTVCGTGTADGSATISGGISVPTAEAPITISYHIQFVAGIGILSGPGGVPNVPPVGVVNIVPTAGDCVSGVTQFEASGAAAIAGA